MLRDPSPPPLIGVVDDQESIREALSALIRSAGYRAVAFESAQAFFEGVHKEQIHCLVLDIDMLGLGALELQLHLAHMKMEIPIIFITARGEVLRGVGLQDGFGAILGKPYTEPALLNSVQSVLDFSKGARKTQ